MCIGHPICENIKNRPSRLILGNPLAFTMTQQLRLPDISYRQLQDICTNVQVLVTKSARLKLLEKLDIERVRDVSRLALTEINVLPCTGKGNGIAVGVFANQVAPLPKADRERREQWETSTSEKRIHSFQQARFAGIVLSNEDVDWRQV
jgi:hypothetical protein